ncbi:helix-turn-helix transcriptional regulator [Chitinophaga sp. XS-30]|uniref:helix-turn-helix transcriptional regulator n=1 Tax=Chitinophaga sp. XS-30 TaxID=2604421 RepID=UPI0011DE4060|nr:response regulator transcription factor [Chitinophaga sp. XS-30]QEH42365.1 helix-turn-helix transcriptional regulator [Chitinophaga sp. XS-30]
MKPISLKIDLDGSWLSDLAEDVNEIAGAHHRVKDGRFVFPAAVAEGFAEVIHVEPGLSLCTLDLMMQTDLVLMITSRSPHTVNFRYNIGSFNSDEIVGPEFYGTTGSNLRSLLVYKSGVVTWLCARKGSYFNYLLVVMTEEWMRANIGEMVMPDSKHFMQRNIQEQFYLYQDIDMPIYTAARQIPEVRSISYDCRAIAYKGIILQLISLSWDRIISQFRETGRINIADKEKMVAYMERIFADLSKPLPAVEKLAAEIFMSKSKFNQLFKKIYQKNVYEYYSQIRMHKAMALLKSGRFSVAEVAHEISYMNHGHFSKAFSKYYGMLPKDCIPRTRNFRIRRNSASGGILRMPEG